MARVIIYTTPVCVFCKMAKAFFAEHGIAYQEKDVAADMHARAEMTQKSGQLGVPVIDIDGAMVIGFDKNKLTELLASGKK